jgi:hypothetical protein
VHLVNQASGRNGIETVTLTNVSVKKNHGRKITQMSLVQQIMDTEKDTDFLISEQFYTEDYEDLTIEYDDYQEVEYDYVADWF